MAKKRKKKGMPAGTALLAVIGLLIYSGECRAFPYRPAATLSILSEYAAMNNSAPPHTQLWKVAPEIGPDGLPVLRFFQEAVVQASPLCELRLPAAGAAGEIQWQGMGQTAQKKSGKGILLMPGFPAPCDILPVGPEAGGGVYEEKVEAGGRVFLKRYRVSVDALTVVQAKAMGWIKVENPGKTGLIMVTVTDDKGRPVVKQLWPADGSWWLYEETPLRRSWLIY